MKKLILSVFILTSFVLNAQTDKVVTSTVKKDVKISEKGVPYATKVKVVTEKTEENKFDPAQKHQLNQDRIPSPVSVTKTVMIDNDKDPFYEKSVKIKYYTYKGRKYSFNVEDNSVLIHYNLDDNDIVSARAFKSRNNRFYIINGAEFNGVGYFNTEGDFVIEYYNKVTNDTEIAVFEDIK